MTLARDRRPASFPDDRDRIRLAHGCRLQWEPRQQSWVMLFPEGMVRLNESAGLVLRRCEAAVRVGALIDDLERRFPGQEVGRDVREFLRDAYEQHWLESLDRG